MLLPVVPLNLMDEEKLDAGAVGLLPALTFQSFVLLLRVALVLLAVVLFFWVLYWWNKVWGDMLNDAGPKKMWTKLQTTWCHHCKYFQVEKTKATTCKVWGREWGRSAAIAYQVLAQLATELPEQPPFPDVFPLFVCCIDSWWCLHRERRRMRRYRCRCFGYKWVMTGWWVAIISCANSHAVCTANAVQVTAAISEPLKNLVA